MSQILTKNQKALLFIIGFLCYTLLALIGLSILIPITFTAFGYEVTRVIKNDSWFNLMAFYPFLFVCFFYILWAIFTCHLNLKQKLIWCFALFALNIIAIPCFFHHMYFIYKGAHKKYSPNIIKMAEKYLALHNSSKSLLNEEQWQAVLDQMKSHQGRKVMLILSPFISGISFFVSIYGYMTLLAIKETHLLVSPLVDAEMWSSFLPAEKWKFIILDYGLICVVGLFFFKGIFLLINSSVNYFCDSKKQLKTLSPFLPKINP